MSQRTPVIAAGVVIAASLAVVGILQDDSGAPQAAKTTSIAAKAKPKHPAHQHKRPHPRTPKLIGQSPRAARDMASARGLRVRFAPSRYDCEGPPSGHVVWQGPNPGQRTYGPWIDAGTSVQTTCGQLHLAAPSCAANQLSLSTNGADAAYAGSSGEISLLVLIKNPRRSPCRVDGTLQLTVVRSGSFDNSIRGNPGTLQVHWGLHGRQTLATEWLWPSWCGPGGSVDLVARFAGLTAKDDSHMPICMDKKAQPYLMGANISPTGAVP
jgi:hypothetical protein